MSPSPAPTVLTGSPGHTVSRTSLSVTTSTLQKPPRSLPQAARFPRETEWHRGWGGAVAACWPCPSGLRAARVAKPHPTHEMPAARGHDGQAVCRHCWTSPGAKPHAQEHPRARCTERGPRSRTTAALSADAGDTGRETQGSRGLDSWGAVRHKDHSLAATAQR